MKQPHKHAELIKAWADGAEIEVWHVDHKAWIACTDPRWNLRCQYRIKPEPKPDVVFGGNAYLDSDGYLLMDLLKKPNIRITFDGETGQLKAAEVLK